MDFLNNIQSFFHFSQANTSQALDNLDSKQYAQQVEARALQMMQDSWELTMQQLEDTRIEVTHEQQANQER